MASVNCVVLAGNLTRDPELKQLPSGSSVAQLGLAVNRTFRDSKTGEKREDVAFIDVEIFGRQAEIACQYLGKGQGVPIEGRLHQDRWEDRTTSQKHQKLKVIASRFQFLGARPGGSSGRNGETTGVGTSASQGRPQELVGAHSTQVRQDIPEDEIPF